MSRHAGTTAARNANEQFFALGVQKGFERFFSQLLGQKAHQVIRSLRLQMGRPLQINLRLF